MEDDLTLEAIRSATALWLKAGDVGEEELLLLERNIASAEDAYRASVGSFEVATRALQGVREALRQRLDATRVAEHVRVASALRTSDGADIPGTAPVEVDLSTVVYFANVPKRFRDVTKYRVDRTVFMDLMSPVAHQDVKVYDAATGGLVWRSKFERSR